MARNDGVDRTTVRNQPRTESNIADAEAHNERQKACYRNDDIVPERSHLNIHFKEPSGSYQEMFRQMEQDGLVERFADPADRRKTLVRITPAGERARKANEQAMNDYFARIMARLTPDQLAQANAVKDALLAAIEAENAAMKTDLKGEPPHDENF